MAKFRPITVRPSDGGRLMTGTSSETAGLSNYTIKRDLRRILDAEVRAEGYDLFAPNPLISSQPPTGEPISLVAMARQENGRTAVVVGTKTTLFRYFGLDNGAYFEDGYIDASYFENNPGVWVTIGSAFSRQGQRWEFVNINGWMVLNNAVDLPVTYRVQDLQVEPIWELRELGIASVGTIAEINGILVCCDIRQINADKHVEIMSTIPLGSIGQEGAFRPVKGPDTTELLQGKINSGVDGVPGNILTCNGEAWPWNREIRMANGQRVTGTYNLLNANQLVVEGDPVLVEPMQPVYFLSHEYDFLLSVTVDQLPAAYQDTSKLLGRRLFFASGDVRTIKGFTYSMRNPTKLSIVVDSDGAIPPCACALENPAAYAAFTDETYIERYHWRVIWSMPNLPRRFGAVVPCSINPKSNTINLKYPVRSLVNGQQVIISGAAAGGGNLTVTLQWVTPQTVTVAGGAILGQVTAVAVALDQARSAENSARISAASTASTLAVAELALAQVKVASEADPDKAELKQAYADASAKVDDARERVDAAAKALADAQAARQKAQSDALATETLLTAADAADSITGNFEDLEGDGSGIIRAMQLRTVLVVYKETEIFIGKYSGQVIKPFVFERVPIQIGTALRFRNTLVSASGAFHVYAGNDAFYRLDLANKVPVEIAEFTPCKDVFFKNAAFEQVLGPDLTGNMVLLTEGQWIIDGLTAGNTYRITYSSTGTVINVTPNLVSPNQSGKMAYGPFWEDDFTRYDDQGNLNYAPILCQEVMERDDAIFACDNPLTKELFFCFPYASGEDKALRFDYRFNSASTTSAAYTAAGMVRRPESKVNVATSEDWFIMGTDLGQVLRYGLVLGEPRASGTITAAKAASENVVRANGSFFTARMVGRSIRFKGGKVFAITGYNNSYEVVVCGNGSAGPETFVVENAVYHRNGQPYDSVLESGMEAFGAPDSEKRMDQYVLFLASDSPSTPIQVDFRGGENAAGATDRLSTTIQSPLSKNMVPLVLLQFFLGDRLTISGINNPAKITGRMFSVAGVNSHSFSRGGKQ